MHVLTSRVAFVTAKRVQFVCTTGLLPCFCCIIQDTSKRYTKKNLKDILKGVEICLWSNVLHAVYK